MELAANGAPFQRRATQWQDGIIIEPTVTNKLSARRGESGFPFLPYFAGTFKPLVYLHVNLLAGVDYTPLIKVKLYFDEALRPLSSKIGPKHPRGFFRPTRFKTKSNNGLDNNY